MKRIDGQSHLIEFFIFCFQKFENSTYERSYLLIKYADYVFLLATTVKLKTILKKQDVA